MLWKNKAGEDIDVALPSGRMLAVSKGETFEVKGDDAKALHDHPLFERVDEPAKKNASDEKDGK